jgi:hypothetical protein
MNFDFITAACVSPYDNLEKRAETFLEGRDFSRGRTTDAHRRPHRSVRAELPHQMYSITFYPAPTLDVWR